MPDVLNTQGFHLFPPMGLMYLSAAVKRDSSHQVSVLDAFLQNWNMERIEQHIREVKPDVVGVYASTHNLYDTMEVVWAAKRAIPGVHVLMGGPHCGAFPEQAIALDDVDAIFMGDAEFALVEWLNALEQGTPLEDVDGFYFKRDGQVVRNRPRQNIQDLDQLPFPDRGAIDLARYFTPAQERTRVTTLIGSRGCPFQCLYCSCRKDYRERSVANIVDEIDELVHKWGIEEINFLDDNFNFKPGRLEDFCNEILRRGTRIRWAFKGACQGMTPALLALARKAGCIRIHYGVETCSDEGYRALHKKGDPQSVRNSIKWTRQAGIKAVAYMMIGLPPRGECRGHPQERKVHPGSEARLRDLLRVQPLSGCPVLRGRSETGLLAGRRLGRFPEPPVSGLQRAHGMEPEDLQGGPAPSPEAPLPGFLLLTRHHRAHPSFRAIVGRPQEAHQGRHLPDSPPAAEGVQAALLTPG